MLRPLPANARQVNTCNRPERLLELPLVWRIEMCETASVWEAAIFLAGFSASLVILIVGGTYGIIRVVDTRIDRGRK